MVRQAYYLRREKYKNAREAVNEFERKKHCILKPGSLISFERGNYEVNEYSTRKLAELYNVSVEELLKEDGHDWKELNRKFGV